ncbi:glycosyltransferase family 2 protein [Vicingus serpentipes]|uniref:Glycosyltransferase family 2 protein n=1 Tax=Vicingus serpentipes TaxID=1926625 RepID=A0A5C6RT28_9FLAO|nr:glycosyltransferase family 2 protein [Vicingus serpentipes]TXB65287.1 glycosyltransferase family 2 protein [Vicingus serpentipes]
MKVCGFTIIRNALKFDYPVVESINSILPLCDEFVVAVGNSDDDTLELIKSINSPKIKIIETIWDDNLRVGGKVLADETNKAFDAISEDFDWCFYIQSDEIVHEKYHAEIKKQLELEANNSSIDGLLFKYKHFYGSYDYVGISRKWYRHEIRIIKNNKKIRSYRDAQGFRINNQKLKVKAIDAYIYHYGWVKHPEQQQAKQQSFNKMWHDDNWMKQNIKDVEEFDYTAIDLLEKFNESHPSVMKNRIEKMNWNFSFDPTIIRLPLKIKITHFIEKLTGYRIGEYKNYRF